MIGRYLILIKKENNMLVIIVIIVGFILGVGIIFAEIDRKLVEKKQEKINKELYELSQKLEIENRKRNKEISDKEYNPEV
jgi:uncharacterized membrane-anchored protein YhcB (DUF1043 family)